MAGSTDAEDLTILAVVPTQREFDALLGVLSESGIETYERTIGRVPALECHGGNVLLAQGGLGKAQNALLTQHLIDHSEGLSLVVCRNLISNAASFSPPGGTIRLSARKSSDWIEVWVEDQGPGLPEGKLEAVFDRFYSERPKREKFGTHSGLGLSISRQVIEAHGGTIHAENLTDPVSGRVRGARFLVRLPVPKGAGP